ncbi:hypothetical protein [Streptomyces sp. NPDC056723]|uniref:hypothetical protein n=1 Tax=Streptomyces sp. NPDC056723 TaxID=3345925 RepID=UPI0036A74C64
MAGVRGIQHKSRAIHPSGKPVRATVILHPGDEERPLYEELVHDLGVSGAEVLREAIKELHKREERRKARKAAKRAVETASADNEELPKAG